uniref:Uncharacterized protein n=1 Tax=Alexandrium andersonii TaxID=327968 RepID=A0A7S2MMF3_9DINO
MADTSMMARMLSGAGVPLADAKQPGREMRRVLLGKDDEEEVCFDPELGPLIFDGSSTLRPALLRLHLPDPQSAQLHKKTWQGMTSTEREVMLITVAKQNRAMKRRMGLQV